MFGVVYYLDLFFGVTFVKQRIYLRDIIADLSIILFEKLKFYALMGLEQ